MRYANIRNWVNRRSDYLVKRSGALARREGEMLGNRKRTVSAWMRQTWPVLLVGLGLVASIVWTAALAWLLVKVIELIA